MLMSFVSICSDDRPELVELMKTLLCDDDDEFSQRGRRVKRRKLSDTEEAPTQVCYHM
jgi:hypothetical protein